VWSTTPSLTVGLLPLALGFVVFAEVFAGLCGPIDARQRFSVILGGVSCLQHPTPLGSIAGAGSQKFPPLPTSD
jgi:hypothetical protein